MTAECTSPRRERAGWWSRRVIIGACLALLAMAFSCPPHVELIVVPGSTAARLELQLEGRHWDHVQMITVYECAPDSTQGRQRWAVARTVRGITPPNRFRYGEVPLGWSGTGIPAASLGPGHYCVYTDGVSASAYFSVTRDSTVVPSPKRS